METAGLTGHLNNVDEAFLAVSGPALFNAGNGRTVFFAVASEGHYHAAHGFGIAAFIDEHRPARAPLFAMPGGAPWGEGGTFNVPIVQPRGAFHVWSAGGNVSFGDAEGWAGVTDFSQAPPRDLGRFLTYGRRSCLREIADNPSTAALCHGAWEYAIQSIAYSSTEPQQLTLQWRMAEFDQRARPGNPDGERVHVRTRDLSASYEIQAGHYVRVGGQEPPRLD